MVSEKRHWMFHTAEARDFSDPKKRLAIGPDRDTEGEALPEMGV